MLIITIGTVASASTWMYNITYGLLASARPNAVCLYAERASDLLCNIPDDADDIVVKTHIMDYSMLRLLSLTDSLVILSYRDTRDSIVSQMERFDLSFRVAATQLARTFATVAMINGSKSKILVLKYEDGFTSNRETLTSIAQHVGVAVEDSILDALFRAFQAEGLKKDIAAGNNGWRWHPKHIGNGQVGKWRDRLSEAQARAILHAFPIDFISDEWKRTPIHWSSVLFQYTDGREPTETETISCSGTEKIVVYGPYLCLPTGRWRVLPVFKLVSSAEPATLKVDIYVNVPTRGMLQLRTIVLSENHGDQEVLDFDNINHLDPIEVRIASVSDARPVGVIFSGVQLTWLGPINQSGFLAARRVKNSVLPAHAGTDLNGNAGIDVLSDLPPGSANETIQAPVRASLPNPSRRVVNSPHVSLRFPASIWKKMRARMRQSMSRPSQRLAT